MRHEGLTKDQIAVVLKDKRMNKVNICCLKMFKYLNPTAKEDDVGNHPLSYFKNSYDAI